MIIVVAASVVCVVRPTPAVRVAATSPATAALARIRATAATWIFFIVHLLSGMPPTVRRAEPSAGERAARNRKPIAKVRQSPPTVALLFVRMAACAY